MPPWNGRPRSSPFNVAIPLCAIIWWMPGSWESHTFRTIQLSIEDGSCQHPQGPQWLCLQSFFGIVCATAHGQQIPHGPVHPFILRHRLVGHQALCQQRPMAGPQPGPAQHHRAVEQQLGSRITATVQATCRILTATEPATVAATSAQPPAAADLPLTGGSSCSRIARPA